MKAITYEQALHRLAAYCSRTERCEYDLRRKMLAWELPAEDQNRLLSYLRNEKYLDDARYVRAYVNDKATFSKWGANKIRFELKKKQLPASLIDEALSGLDKEETKETLIRLLTQKKKSVKGKDNYDIRMKLIRFAAGRGYSFEEIEAALSQIK